MCGRGPLLLTPVTHYQILPTQEYLKRYEKMETLMSMEEMKAQLEQLEREETEIDDELTQVIKQQPDLLVKGIGFQTFFRYFLASEGLKLFETTSFMIIMLQISL